MQAKLTLLALSTYKRLTAGDAPSNQYVVITPLPYQTTYSDLCYVFLYQLISTYSHSKSPVLSLSRQDQYIICLFLFHIASILEVGRYEPAWHYWIYGTSKFIQNTNTSTNDTTLRHKKHNSVQSLWWQSTIISILGVYQGFWVILSTLPIKLELDCVLVLFWDPGGWSYINHLHRTGIMEHKNSVLSSSLICRTTGADF